MLNPEREIEMVKDPREFGLRVSIKMGNLIYKCFCQLLLREPQELVESFWLPELSLEFNHRCKISEITPNISSDHEMKMISFPLPIQVKLHDCSCALQSKTGQNWPTFSKMFYRPGGNILWDFFDPGSLFSVFALLPYFLFFIIKYTPLKI